MPILAGTIGVIINVLLLYLGAKLSINAGKGGLLKFLAKILHIYPIPWEHGYLKYISPKLGKLGFHYITGIIMAIIYVYIIDPMFKSLLTIAKALSYALVVWLINALIVLPGLGYGIAGVDKIPLIGIV